MRNKYCFTAVLLATIVLCAYFLTGMYVKHQNMDEKEDITVVTSFYPLYIAAANVVTDCEGIQVKSLSEPQTGCLHDFQMTPEDMKLLSTADVFVVNGGGMESFLSDVREQYPSLPIIETMHLTNEGEHLHEEDNHEMHNHKEETQEAFDHEHVHENTHIWMSVRHYREQVAAITEALCAVVQENMEGEMQERCIAGIESNAKKYDTKLAELEAQQQEIAKVAKEKPVISLHEAYEFVAEDYGFEVVYTLNLDEERQVSAGEVGDVLKEIRDNSVSILLAEEQYGKGLAETIQEEADVGVYYLDTLVRGDSDLDSYINGMQKNIQILRKAFGVK